MYTYTFKYHLTKVYAPVTVRAKSIEAAWRKARRHGVSRLVCDECGDYLWYLAISDDPEF